MSSSAISASTTAAALIQTGNGEYTAASVASDQKDATSKGLVKLPDGNYGTSSPLLAPVTTTGSAATQSASAVLSAISGLTLGGA